MNKLYKNVDGNSINLEINNTTDNCILITVHNLNYISCLQRNISILCLILVCLAYSISFTQFYNLILILLCIALILFYKIYNLVKFEKIYVYKNFALQATTEFTFNRKHNLFISDTNFKDLIINEVICDLRVVFVLNILTKGSLFATKPIIPMLQHTKPNLECLEAIYRILYRKLNTS